MSSELEENFTITWQVKNFSMCPTKCGSFIESPVFMVRQFGNSEWCLQFYPKGCKTEGFLACFLICKSLGSLGDYKTVKVEIELAVVKESSDKRLKYTEHNFIQSREWGYDQFISIDDVVKEKNGYLPKDTLTIKCSMQGKILNVSKNVDNEIMNALSWNFIVGKNSLITNKICCETTIRVQTKRFLWMIPRFLSLSKNERFTLPVFSLMKETPSFIVTLFKNEESFINIEIRRKDNKSKSTFVRCAVSAVNTPKDVNYCLEDEFLFKSEGDVWSIPRFLDVSVLEKDGYLKFNDGVLYLQFDFAFSIPDELHHIEKQEWEPPFPPTKSFVPLELFTTPTTGNNDKHTVVTLRAEHRNFSVHKALLKAKSEVFHAMFENDMKEKGTGVVDISDVEPETLGRMLSFLYSGTVGDLSTTDVINLHAAAHKYQVLCLMDYCSSVLRLSLTVSNVCEIIKFADLYRDERLLKAAEEFLIADSDSVRILISQDWKNLMENNPSLVANIMYKMLIT